jgi:hypothetical protein
MQKGDILGHEFCDVVESVGSGILKVKPGDRVVCSFQIACGQCMYCKKKLSSMCERTNDNKIQNVMYGGQTAAMLGYSHFTGGFAGGQAEYVRVAHGDVNLLKLPDDVLDEKGLYLSDVLATSWNCVVDTGVKEGDVVAIWARARLAIAKNSAKEMKTTAMAGSGVGPEGNPVVSPDQAFKSFDWSAIMCQILIPRRSVCQLSKAPATTAANLQLRFGKRAKQRRYRRSAHVRR